MTLAQQTLRTAESLYRAGETVETSVLRARVAESDARRELLMAENSLILGRQQLMLLTGLTGDIELTRPAGTRPIDTPLEELIKQGLSARPELKALALQRQIASLEVDVRRGQWFPTIQAEVVYQKRKATFPSSQIGSVAVNAVWPIFDGGRRQAAVATARLQVNEVTLQEELVKRQTSVQIRSAYLAMQTLDASVQLLKSQIEVARRNADETNKAYQVGEATDLDVLQSNNALTQSERQLAQATFQYRSRDLRFAAGRRDVRRGSGAPRGRRRANEQDQDGGAVAIAIALLAVSVAACGRSAIHGGAGGRDGVAGHRA